MHEAVATALNHLRDVNNDLYEALTYAFGELGEDLGGDLETVGNLLSLNKDGKPAERVGYQLGRLDQAIDLVAQAIQVTAPVQKPNIIVKQSPPTEVQHPKITIKHDGSDAYDDTGADPEDNEDN